MPANTQYILTGPLEMQNTYAAGTFGVVNRDPLGRSISVEVQAKRGQLAGPADIVNLPNFGDALSIDLSTIASFRLTATAYPATILWVYTGLDISLEAAPAVTAGPGGLPVTMTNPIAKIASLIQSGGPPPSPWADGVVGDIVFDAVEEIGDPAYVYADLATNSLRVVRPGVYLVDTEVQAVGDAGVVLAGVEMYVTPLGYLPLDKRGGPYGGNAARSEMDPTAAASMRLTAGAYTMTMLCTTVVPAGTGGIYGARFGMTYLGD